MDDDAAQIYRDPKAATWELRAVIDAQEREIEALRAAATAGPPAAIVWRPMTERPADITTAMIRHTDAEGAHLMPGPVAWSIPQQRWISERTALPVELRCHGSAYHWCYERDIVGAAA